MAAIGGDFGAWVNGSEQGLQLKKKKRFVRLVFVFFIVLVGWSYWALLAEVSNGTGKVVPTSQEQVIQSLEGGVVAKLMVRQDDVVEPGQILAQLDPTVTESNVQESAAKYRAALASSARLKAEVGQTDLEFPAELNSFSLLKAAEIQLFEARKRSLKDALSWITESKQLVQDELNISQSLSKMGAASNVEVIRLKRQLVELQLKETEIKSDYIVKAREELAKANADVDSLSSVVRGRSDALARLTLRSPVRGIVKNIEVSTIGVLCLQMAS